MVHSCGRFESVLVNSVRAALLVFVCKYSCLISAAGGTGKGISSDIIIMHNYAI